MKRILSIIMSLFAFLLLFGRCGDGVQGNQLNSDSSNTNSQFSDNDTTGLFYGFSHIVFRHNTLGLEVEGETMGDIKVFDRYPSESEKNKAISETLDSRDITSRKITSIEQKNFYVYTSLKDAQSAKNNKAEIRESRLKEASESATAMFNEVIKMENEMYSEIISPDDIGLQKIDSWFQISCPCKLKHIKVQGEPNSTFVNYSCISRRKGRLSTYDIFASPTSLSEDELLSLNANDYRGSGYYVQYTQYMGKKAIIYEGTVGEMPFLGIVFIHNNRKYQLEVQSNDYFRPRFELFKDSFQFL